MQGVRSAAVSTKPKPTAEPLKAQQAPSVQGSLWNVLASTSARPDWLGGVLSRKCACAAGGESCRSCGEEMLSRSADGARPAEVPASVRRVLASPGAPLPAAARARME